MSKHAIRPFQNESESLQIGDLTIENRLDRLSIYGSIDLTLDREGLAKARELKTVLDLALAVMEKTELPDRIATKAEETVENPFA
jgi:hypothetical protein